jgi:hypothetical protein
VNAGASDAALVDRAPRKASRSSRDCAALAPDPASTYLSVLELPTDNPA